MACSFASADEKECKDILQEIGSGESVYYSYAGFPAIHIVPLNLCGIYSECAYRVELHGGNEPAVLKDNLRTDSLCKSLKFNLKSTKNDAYDEEGPPGISQFEEVETYSYVLSTGDEQIIAIRNRYYNSDLVDRSGLWHSSRSGGKYWNTEMTVSQVYAE